MLTVPELPAVVPAVRAHGRYGVREGLRDFLCATLQSAYPGAIDTLTLVDAAARQFGLTFPNAEARHRFRDESVGKALRNLFAREEIERLHDFKVTPNSVGAWRWKVEMPALEELRKATFAQASLSELPQLVDRPEQKYAAQDAGPDKHDHCRQRTSNELSEATLRHGEALRGVVLKKKGPKNFDEDHDSARGKKRGECCHGSCSYVRHSPFVGQRTVLAHRVPYDAKGQEHHRDGTPKDVCPGHSNSSYKLANPRSWFGNKVGHAAPNEQAECSEHQDDCKEGDNSGERKGSHASCSATSHSGPECIAAAERG